MTPRWLAVPVLAALCGVPAAAEAHAILLESRPAPGGTVDAGRIDLWLRFNSRIDAARSRLTLTRPDHRQVVLPTSVPAATTGTDDVLAASAELPPGAYTLRWQVLAIDGHITRGDIGFTVRGR
jgi:methionine-rich copper-binding protein CopC